MCHYQFEMLHPYEYNNGIVGRILICKMLNDAGIKSVRYLNLSTCFYRRKAEYFEKLGLAQKNGSYDIWLSFFIRAVTEAAYQSIEFVKAFEQLLRCDEEKITSQCEMSDYTMKVYRYFKKNMVSNISQSSRQLSLSFNTVSKTIVLAYDLSQKGQRIILLFLDYGQHCVEKELETLKRVCPELYKDNVRIISFFVRIM